MCTGRTKKSYVSKLKVTQRRCNRFVWSTNVPACYAESTEPSWTDRGSHSSEKLAFFGFVLYLRTVGDSARKKVFPAALAHFLSKKSSLQLVTRATLPYNVPRGPVYPCRPYRTGGGGCTSGRTVGASKICSEDEMQAIP